MFVRAKILPETGLPDSLFGARKNKNYTHNNNMSKKKKNAFSGRLVRRVRTTIKIDGHDDNADLDGGAPRQTHHVYNII